MGAEQLQPWQGGAAAAARSALAMLDAGQCRPMPAAHREAGEPSWCKLWCGPSRQPACCTVFILHRPQPPHLVHCIVDNSRLWQVIAAADHCLHRLWGRQDHHTLVGQPEAPQPARTVLLCIALEKAMHVRLADLRVERGKAARPGLKGRWRAGTPAAAVAGSTQRRTAWLARWRYLRLTNTMSPA